MAVKLRPGTATDAESLSSLIAEFQSELNSHPDGLGAEKYLASVSSQSLRDYLESSRYGYLVAEQEDALLGFIALRDGSHIFHLFVARNHQRKGVARLLWQTAKAQALSTVTPGHFTVNSSLGAVPVYRAFGFESTSEAAFVNGIAFVPMRLNVTC